MIIIAWMLLILNALVGVKNFIEVFTEKTTTDRVASFMGCIINALMCIQSIYILRL